MESNLNYKNQKGKAANVPIVRPVSNGVKKIAKYIASAYSLVLLGTTQIASAATSESLQNPLQFNGIAEFVAGALKAMVIVALPLIALAIVYSGFMFVSARGNEEGISTAKRNFTYVVIGAILILGAWVIATLIGGTVTQLTR